MKKVIKKSLGFEVPVGEYESDAEASKELGVPSGALIAEGNTNLWYRGAAAEAREVIAEAVEKLTGIKRETRQSVKKVKDEKTGKVVETPATNSKGEPVLEFVLDEDEFVKTALAKSGKTIAQLQPDVVKHIEAANGGKGINVSIKRQVRVGGSRVLATKHLEAAKNILSDPVKLAGFAKRFASLTGNPLPDDAKTDTTALGWKIKEYEVQALAGLK